MSLCFKRARIGAVKSWSGVLLIDITVPEKMKIVNKLKDLTEECVGFLPSRRRKRKNG